MGKNSLLNKWCWDNWMSTGKNMNLDTKLTPFKNELKMDHRPECKCKTIKFLEDIIGGNLDNFGCGDDFLDTTPKT